LLSRELILSGHVLLHVLEEGGNQILMLLDLLLILELLFFEFGCKFIDFLLLLV
jgi:hypothetical protein